MAFKLPEWLTNLNNGVSLFAGLGIPVTGLVAWVIGRVAHMRLLDIAILFCAIFLTCLWSWIGLVWLSDRAKRFANENAKPVFVCDWGIQVEVVQLNRDATNADLRWQFLTVIRNSKDFPLRIKAVENVLVIEKRLPSMKMESIGSQVIPSKGVIAINSSLYGKDALPDLDRLTGEIGFKIHYGHPTHGFSRTFEYHHRFTAIIRAPAPAEGMFIPPLLPPYFPAISPVVEDRDYPYVEPVTALLN